MADEFVSGGVCRQTHQAVDTQLRSIVAKLDQLQDSQTRTEHALTGEIGGAPGIQETLRRLNETLRALEGRLDEGHGRFRALEGRLGEQEMVMERKLLGAEDERDELRAQMKVLQDAERERRRWTRGWVKWSLDLMKLAIGAAAGAWMTYLIFGGRS